MVINEITWRIVPPALEGAGYFEIRQRAEVEVRKLRLEIKRYEQDALNWKACSEEWASMAKLWCERAEAAGWKPAE